MFKRLVTCTGTIYLDMSTRLETETGIENPDGYCFTNNETKLFTVESADDN